MPSSSQRQTEADRSHSYASEQQRLASSSDSESSSSSSSEEDDAELYAVVQQAMLAFERPSSKRRPQQLPPSQLQSAPLHQQSRANAPTSPSPVNPDQAPAQQPAQRQAPPPQQEVAESRPASARQHRDPTAAVAVASQHTSQQMLEGSDDPFARGGFLTHEELARRRAARLQRAEMEAHRDLTYQPRIYKSRVRSDLVIPRPSKILPASSSAAGPAPHGDEPRRESPRGPAWAKRLYHRDFSDRQRRAENYEQLRLDTKQREELLSEMQCTFAPTTTVPPSWCARSKRTAEDACAALYRRAHRQQQQQEAAAAEKDGTAAPSNAGNGQVAVRMNDVQRRLFNDAIRRQGGRLEALQEAKKARQRSSSRHWSPPSARPTDSHYYVMTDD